MNTRSTPRKASKASKAPKAFKASKTTSRAAAKAPVGVIKPRKASKISPRTPRIYKRRFRRATSSPDTITSDKIPETDLEIPPASDNYMIRFREVEKAIARMRTGNNTYLEGHRVTDSLYKPRR